MTPEQRERNLTKARRASAEARSRRTRERAEAHAVAKPKYEEACRVYYLTRSTHGEGSPEEREAFRAMLRAEVDWFDTYPKSEAAA